MQKLSFSIIFNLMKFSQFFLFFFLKKILIKIKKFKMLKKLEIDREKVKKSFNFLIIFSGVSIPDQTVLEGKRLPQVFPLNSLIKLYKKTWTVLWCEDRGVRQWGDAYLHMVSSKFLILSQNFYKEGCELKRNRGLDKERTSSRDEERREI